MGDNLGKTLINETDCVINLASKEYSVCVCKYLPDFVRFITCVFGEEKGDKVIEKGTMCKMARGEMAGLECDFVTVIFLCFRYPIKNTNWR